MLAHVHRPAAVKLHHPAGAGRAVGGELLVVDRPRGGHVEDAPAGVSHSLLEVDLLRVDEEVGVQVAHLLRGLVPHQHGRRLHPAHLAHLAAVAGGGARVLGDQPAVQEQGLGQRGAEAGQPPRAGNRLAVGVEELGSRGGRLGIGVQRLEQGLGCALEDLGVLVQQQAEAPAGLAQEQRVVLRQAGAAVAGDHPDLRKAPRHGLRASRRRRRCRAPGSRARSAGGGCGRSPPGR